MVDFYVEEYSKYHGKEPAAAHLQVTPAVVNGQLRDWKAACGPLLDLLNDADLVDSLRKDNRFTLEHLKASHNVCVCARCVSARRTQTSHLLFPLLLVVR
jgi:hypothetical protein